MGEGDAVSLDLGTLGACGFVGFCGSETEILVFKREDGEGKEGNG